MMGDYTHYRGPGRYPDAIVDRAEAVGVEPCYLHCGACAKGDNGGMGIGNQFACAVDGVDRTTGEDCAHPSEFEPELRTSEERWPHVDWEKFRRHNTVSAQLERVVRHSDGAPDVVGGLPLYRDSKGPKLKEASDAA